MEGGFYREGAFSLEDRIKLSGIVSESIVDGIGIRYVVFTQGCKHNCEGCHNPSTHDFSKGYYKTVQELFEEIEKNPLIRGITLSGGEPFEQAPPLIALARLAKSIGKDIWAYSGYTYEQLQADITPNSNQLLELVDVLVDGKFVLAQRDLTLRFRGSKNQRVIDCNTTRSNKDITLYSME